MQRDADAAAAWRRAERVAAHVAPPAAAPSRDGAPAALRRADAAAPASRRGPAVLIGGVVMDLQAWPDAGAAPRAGTTVPGEVRRVPGGVARNIAAVLATLSALSAASDAHAEVSLPPPLLVSAVGDDAHGAALLAHMRSLGLPTRGVRVVAGARTATVVAVFGGDGDIAAAVADCALLEAELTPEWIGRFSADIAAAPVLLLDANAAPDALAAAAAAATAAATPLWVEPVSVAKAARASPLLSKTAFVSPNAAELIALAHAARTAAGHCADAPGVAPQLPPLPPPGAPPPSYAHAAAALDHLRPCIDTLLRAGCAHCVTTLGALGALLSSGRRGDEAKSSAITHLHLPAVPIAAVVSTAGAGDALVAGALGALCGAHGEGRGGAAEAVAAGLAAAAVVVQRAENAPPRAAWPPPAGLRAAAAGALRGMRTLE